MLGITDHYTVITGEKVDLGFDLSRVKADNPDEISLDGNDSDTIQDEADEEEGAGPAELGPITEQDSRTLVESTVNPAEISLDSDSEDENDNEAQFPELKDKNGSFQEGLSSKLSMKLPEPKLSGLTLPKPVLSEPETVKTNAAKSEGQGSVEQRTAKGESAPDKEQSEVPKEVPPKKKFKRRNQAMYESTDE